MRYMWSEMDSPCAMPQRRQPSRFVVFSRSTRWKKATGDADCSSNFSGISPRTAASRERR
ncbi:hypothetical protein KEM52_003498, partial [Ascosphaera acerosa]